MEQQNKKPETKYFRHPARNQQPAPYEPYVPQYKLRGIEPIDGFGGGTMQSSPALSKPAVVQILAKKPPTLAQQERQIYPTNKNLPYAEPGIEFYKGQMPNVGNNSETAWTGIDNYIVDDLSLDNRDIDLTSPMIDNNDYVDIAAVQLQSNVNIYEDISAWKAPKIEVNMDPQVNFPENVFELEDAVNVLEVPQLNINFSEYILMLKNDIISVGQFENIQEEIRKLVFNEHPLSTSDLAVEDIVVLKRVKINIGVFLDKE